MFIETISHLPRYSPKRKPIFQFFNKNLLVGELNANDAATFVDIFPYRTLPLDGCQHL